MRRDIFRSVPFGKTASGLCLLARPGVGQGGLGNNSRGGCFGSTSISTALGGRGNAAMSVRIDAVAVAKGVGNVSKW